MGAEKEYIGELRGIPRRDYGACDTGTQAVAPITDSEVINKLFTYHAPTPLSGQKYDNIREAAKHFAQVIAINVPYGADRTAAIRKVREAVMTANAGVALDGCSL